ncbi:hypothetical protein COCC4DRAFT_200428 [Bipolaris maydis ATCC 48331]|uniref:Uncharacterized protein n=2 Tax=Cochliobolus heterostrophus TaxID=5016 RepID=M2SMM0_COCH5|nr:uncharacterized protein COCC4DRAFT_200428 [Bipolaris maydis ATCC 48331]EMD86585.1 hypothetical protein COCHEDRAFT_1185703 [Bipolaris maydis C5]KAJ5052662.1 hypothetical protein J3E74DRAFT_283031 [Bipolaris maydis]ENI02999.1 hypothetical protein COCC4DRAFT_200428 [Bipolaris maydis ATCC 48331]KAJ6192332.1 hypothetical protein J3E72DRAFT_389801 [Bipolaris maydis]KAJ6203813.1 hypothetical protein PSV09DRAFT_1185703 [Bipolaris maydis]
MAMSQADLARRQEVTPPPSSTQRPLTPPPTDEKPFQTAERVIDLCKRIRAGKDTNQDLDVLFKLEKPEYEYLNEKLEQDDELWDYIQDKIRFCCNTNTRTIVIRMPHEIHERFIDKVEGGIRTQIQTIALGSGKLAEFAKRVNSSRSAEIRFEDSKSKYHPDASFRHDIVKYPGVVIEVAFSQKKTLLNKLAEDYLMESNGNIRVVICLKLPYPKTLREATLSVWRPRISETRDGYMLESVEEVKDQVFRDDQGNPVDDSGLQLYLSDFACKTFANKELEDEDAQICISGKTLYEYIKYAEDSVQGAQYVELLDPIIRKRKRQTTPEEEILSSDEAKYAKQEAMEEKRGDDDSDYQNRSSGESFSD